MQKTHNKNTVRYFLIIVILLSFLFFSSDFGMLDVQKTAIIMAVGVDKEDDTFIITSQVAVPQSSKQGKASEAVQIVSRGKTVADAFEEINAKTGWYPKLVFCDLIILGEKAAQEDVFDALDFFLLDEYMSDDCLLVTCDGFAKDLLNVGALVDPSGSVAMQKVLSPHAERVGTVLPSTLREFAIGYYSESKSGYLPLVKTEPQQEHIGGNSSDGSSSSSESSGSSSEKSSSSESSGSSESAAGGGSSESGGSGGGQTDKPVFSAGETALFVGGKRVGLLSKEETFAFNAVKHELRLAAYSVETENAACTLTVKRNDKTTKFSVGKDGRATLKINLTLSAGLLDYSKALPLESVTDIGDVPEGVFALAEKRLTGQIITTFEKCRACGCDLFGVSERLYKYENSRFEELKDTVLQTAIADVSVKFRNVR